MSKTFIYVLAVIAIYMIVIFPKVASDNSKKETDKTESNGKADTESGTGLSENPDKNGVSQGAAGQQKYRIGYVK